MSALPPMGGVAPPLQCNRDLNGNPGSGNERLCGREGKWHIIWTSDVENGICCDEHYQEARERWGFYAVHEYTPDCSMPGAVYVFAENVCVVDEQGLALSQEAKDLEQRAAVRAKAMKDARLPDDVGPWPRFTRVHTVGDYLSQYDLQFVRHRDEDRA